VAGTLFDGGRLRQRVEIQNAVQEQALASYQNTLADRLAGSGGCPGRLANQRLRQEALACRRSRRNPALLGADRPYRSGLVDSSPCSTASAACSASKTSLPSHVARVTALIQLQGLGPAGGGHRCIQRFFRQPRQHAARNHHDFATRRREQLSRVLAAAAPAAWRQVRWIAAAGLLLVCRARLLRWQGNAGPRRAM